MEEHVPEMLESSWKEEKIIVPLEFIQRSVTPLFLSFNNENMRKTATITAKSVRYVPLDR